MKLKEVNIFEQGNNLGYCYFQSSDYQTSSGKFCVYRKAKTMCDKEKKEKDEEDARLLITGEGTLMDKYTFRFKNQLLEDEVQFFIY